MFQLSRGWRNRENDVELWPCIVPTLLKWFDHTIQNSPITREKVATDIQFIIVSDASLSGWGGYVFCLADSSIRFATGKWSPAEKKRPIADLETLAVFNTLVALVPLKAKCRIFIDNTTTESALNKRRSRSYWVNTHTQLIVEKWNIVSASYIPSAKNPADPLSRGQTHPPLIASILKNLSLGQLPSRPTDWETGEATYDKV